MPHYFPSGVGSVEGPALLRSDVRLLLLEDEPLLLLSFEDTLASLGYETVLGARSLQEAEAIVEGGEIDLALLDVHVRRETSYDLARTLRERNIPFLFLTGSSAHDAPAEFAGVVFISKPFREEDLQRALSSALDGGKKVGGASPPPIYPSEAFANEVERPSVPPNRAAAKSAG